MEFSELSSQMFFEMTIEKYNVKKTAAVNLYQEKQNRKNTFSGSE